ncbi:MAG: hypothetical protein IT464_09190 [Planctomycetes bacterium]|nr:hypothetical protein [Planctomycetota bacterium]
MRIVSVFLLFVVLVAGCGGGANTVAEATDSDLRQRAKSAEGNLERIRDSVLKYYAAKKAPPHSVSDLESFGASEKDLIPTEDYADIGYAFFSLKFDAAGKLVRGWFLATPKGNSNALQVRMNGVSGKFEHLPKGETWTAANEDEGWAPGEEPKESDGVEVK